MQIVLHHTASQGMRRLLANRAAGSGDQVVVVDLHDAEGLAREMRDAEVLFHVLAPVGEAQFAAAPRLRMVQKIGVGLDTIDLAAAARRGIKVANMPGTNSRAVAELTLLLMLGALRRVAWLDRKIRAGEGWTLAADSFDGMGEIHGRTIGLIGYGQVARLLAPVLTALGARVIHHARSQGTDGWRPLETLLETSDIVSLHLPLTDRTTRMIDAAALARMKPGVVLVNTARGGLIDESALLAALQSGHVAAAGLDTLAREPAGPGHPFFALDNVLLTPHVAWLTPETLARSMTVAFENCRRLERGDPLRFQVEPSLS